MGTRRLTRLVPSRRVLFPSSMKVMSLTRTPMWGNIGCGQLATMSRYFALLGRQLVEMALNSNNPSFIPFIKPRLAQTLTIFLYRLSPHDPFPRPYYYLNKNQRRGTNWNQGQMQRDTPDIASHVPHLRVPTTSLTDSLVPNLAKGKMNGI